MFFFRYFMLLKDTQPQTIAAWWSENGPNSNRMKFYCSSIRPTTCGTVWKTSYETLFENSKAYTKYHSVWR